eukprot:CAMPEP_0197053002 /NCGR_PEP_ID=MMETSP1384-20130603/27371_1 /TAXON_ID=29189 /ORGANISM="Ammonia sp." /LENGTH=544 /DNA_ID=CAMNT_0042485831 /DNA_START=29 /DNA_END=1663 /DNA_ORIENTATION=-
MGNSPSANILCDGVYKICSAPTEDVNSYNEEAQRETLDEYDSRTKEVESANLRTLINLIKCAADKQSLSSRCDDPSQFKLLYRGSKNGFKISTLHSHIDNIAHLFIMITTVDCTFGCYTSKGFDASITANRYIPDSDAFLFRLRTSTKKKKKNTAANAASFEPQIFALSSPDRQQYALFHSEHHRLLQIGGGPGSEPDICIVEDCHKMPGSFALKSSYSAQDGHLNAGVTDFKVKELLVYTVSNVDTLQYQPLKAAADASPLEHKLDEETDDEENADEQEQKVYVFVVNASKRDEFKEPLYVTDIDENSPNYAGRINVSGAAWDDELQRFSSDVFVDISKPLQKLQIQQFECKVMMYGEDAVNTGKLVRVAAANQSDTQDDDGVDDHDDEQKVIAMQKAGLADLELPDKTLLPSISEDVSEQATSAELLRRRSKHLMDKRQELQRLRMKYSSKRVVLPGKSSKKQPKCAECNTYYHIQSDPVNAYNGVGITCDVCGKNRETNPELLLEEHYYKCESCQNTDICSACYKQEMKKLQEAVQHKNVN